MALGSVNDVGHHASLPTVKAISANLRDANENHVDFGNALLCWLIADHEMLNCQRTKVEK